LPSENIQQVEAFLEQHPDFKLQHHQEIWPSTGFDGFFMARMKRKA
jgi:16S rRNA (cytosine967-C5)-methyltransferase